MGKNVIIVGGGLAGLAASVYLARAGRSVTIFEKRRVLGGRAVTHLRQGYRFNLGPHALYRRGAGAAVLRQLGIPLRGGSPPGTGIALLNSKRYRFPGTIASLLMTDLLPLKAKMEAASLLVRLRRMHLAELFAMSFRDWLDARVANPHTRRLVEAIGRLTTYSDHPELQSAATVLGQIQIATRGVLYVDEGWQKLVDSLHSNAISAGVSFVTSSRVVAIDHDGEAVRGVELGGFELDDRSNTLSVARPDVTEGVKGTRIPAGSVLLAVDPATARELVSVEGDPPFVANWAALRPVTLTCLDVALSSLPVPNVTFALGIDKPYYYSVHSKWAQLTPRGGALIHVAKYRRQPAAVSDDEIDAAVNAQHRAAGEEYELEHLLDNFQPGWRGVLVHRRFLTGMTVANALVEPGLTRPAPSTPVAGLYLAGDWVGNEGILVDAALASARSAAQAILAS